MVKRMGIVTTGRVGAIKVWLGTRAYQVANPRGTSKTMPRIGIRTSRGRTR